MFVSDQSNLKFSCLSMYDRKKDGDWYAQT